VLALQRVAVNDSDVGPIGEAPGQNRGEIVVNLHHHQVTGRLGQQFTQPAGTTADLEHDIVGGDFGGLDQLAHQVAVDQKMLAEAAVRMQPSSR
jgi:hypothetical protein